MMRIITLATIIGACFLGCSKSEQGSNYLRWVGDIEHNLATDNPEFEVCHGEDQVRQYFNFSQGMQYEGEKITLVNQFEEKYIPVESSQSGWLRIRFIVNCEGQTGRFRVIGSDNSYQEQTFDSEITDQLVSIVKQLDGWKLLPNEESPFDYYQYLTFKIDNGAITGILP